MFDYLYPVILKDSFLGRMSQVQAAVSKGPVFQD